MLPASVTQLPSRQFSPAGGARVVEKVITPVCVSQIHTRPVLSGTASVVAVDESELLRLDKDAFRKIMEENPRADELISTVLSRRQEYSAEKKAAKDAQLGQQGESDATSNTRALFVKKIRDFFSY